MWAYSATHMRKSFCHSPARPCLTHVKAPETHLAAAFECLMGFFPPEMMLYELFLEGKAGEIMLF